MSNPVNAVMMPNTTQKVLEALEGRSVLSAKRILVAALVQVGAYDEAIDALFVMKKQEAV